MEHSLYDQVNPEFINNFIKFWTHIINFEEILGKPKNSPLEKFFYVDTFWRYIDEISKNCWIPGFSQKSCTVTHKNDEIYF